MGFGLEVELGSMPIAFFRAVEATARDTLRQGLHGWEVTDCAVTTTYCRYLPRQSHAHQGFSKSMSSTGADFRGPTPLVVMNALRRAGTNVFEPIHRFSLEIPGETLGAVLPVLAQLHAVARASSVHGASCALEGDIPAARIRALRLQLPSLSRGEGVLETTFDGYRRVTGPAPRRPRSDHNPLNREGYLLRVARRVAMAAG
jgi:ribosomal protection tetracycline resistance protein